MYSSILRASRWRYAKDISRFSFFCLNPISTQQFRKGSDCLHAIRHRFFLSVQPYGGYPQPPCPTHIVYQRISNVQNLARRKPSIFKCKLEQLRPRFVGTRVLAGEYSCGRQAVMRNARCNVRIINIGNEIDWNRTTRKKRCRVRKDGRLCPQWENFFTQPHRVLLRTKLPDSLRY